MEVLGKKVIAGFAPASFPIHSRKTKDILNKHLDINLKYNETVQIETNWFSMKVWLQCYLNFKSNTLIGKLV